MQSGVGLSPAARGLLWGLAAVALGSSGWLLVWMLQLCLAVGGPLAVPNIMPAATFAFRAGAALGAFCLARGCYLQARSGAWLHRLVALLAPPPKRPAVSVYRVQAEQLEPDVDARSAAPIPDARRLWTPRSALLGLAVLGFALAPLVSAFRHSIFRGDLTESDSVTPLEARIGKNHLAEPSADEPFEHERAHAAADARVLDRDPALRARREKEAKTVEKETIILYDRRGDPIPTRPTK